MFRWLQSAEATRRLPVVVISADAMAPQIKQMMAAGARAYLIKPINVSEFLEVVDRFLTPALHSKS
jgi:CheY-like chemotaxis protein